MASLTSASREKVPNLEILDTVADFFGAADPVALALTLAFIVPVVYARLRQKDFGENTKMVMCKLEMARKKVIVDVASKYDGDHIWHVLGKITSDEGRKVLLPVTIDNTRLRWLEVLTITLGVIITFYDSLKSSFPLHDGILWLAFLVSLIFSLIYLYHDTLY